MWQQKTISITSKGRGTYDITGEIEKIIVNNKKRKIHTGLCHVFVRHTSASLILCENADSQVRMDLEHFMAKLTPDGNPLFSHTMEGPDDMPAHIRSILTSNDLSIPITAGQLMLGTWQGVYLWEHRLRSHHRQIVVTIQGQ
ncbi:MAG TPA: YjbQ family protein [Gammaproteobacteria bacterium]|nr:YjbQ family protein [Gammaproteobacteria bacterium]